MTAASVTAAGSTPSLTEAGKRLRCAVVGTGGTIATRGSDLLDTNEYMYGGSSLDPESALSALPDFPGRPEVEPIDFVRKPSHDLDTADQVALARKVAALRARPDIDAVVIQHGTNTLEETAFVLDLLLLPSGKPVVVVGSMRPAGVLGTDAETNLLDALRVATHPNASDRGVLVTVGGDIFAASDVTKMDSRALAGFAAPRVGRVGTVEPDGMVYLRGPHPSGPGLLERLSDDGDLPRVDIVVSHVGADGRLIEAACAAGARGLVSAGTGGGFPTAAEVAALRAAADGGVLVCRSSRVASAYVQPPGRTADDPDPSFVWSGRLNAYQARAVLAVALAVGGSTEAAAPIARGLMARY